MITHPPDHITPGLDLASSAAAEWTALVSTAVVGTDRRLPPPADPGWQVWCSSTDPAVALLDRAAAVVVARRAGARADAATDAPLPAAPVDTRPPCSAACAARLDRIVGGQHDVLLPEWLNVCGSSGAQLPWAALPALLLRGRRHPELDQAVRQLAGARADWLAEVMPELGVRVGRSAPGRSAPGRSAAAATPTGWGQPPVLTDSGAIVSGIVQVFVDGMATWAAAPQLRLTAAAIDPAWLPTLIVQLSRLPFHAATQRTLADVLSLAEFRLAMLREFHPPTSEPLSIASQVDHS